MAVSLTINSVSIVTPTAIVRDEIKAVSSRRTLANKKKTDIIDYDKKTVMILSWNQLTKTELDAIKAIVDTGEYSTVLDDPDNFYDFTGTCTFTMNPYREAYSGNKQGINVTLEEV